MSDSDTEIDGVYGFIPKTKCSQIRGCDDLFIYLKQNPRTFVSTIAFVTELACVLLVTVAYSSNFHSNVCYSIAAVAGIASSLYGFCHFRTLMNLKKKEVAVYSTNNKKFAEETTLLNKEINRFSSAKHELQDTCERTQDAIRQQEVNFQKNRQLSVNLEATGIKMDQLFAKVRKKIETTGKAQLFAKKKTYTIHMS
eukprot:72173_1